MRYNVYSQNFKRVEMKYNNSIRRKDFSNEHSRESEQFSRLFIRSRD